MRCGVISSLSRQKIYILSRYFELTYSRYADNDDNNYSNDNIDHDDMNMTIDMMMIIVMLIMIQNVRLLQKLVDILTYPISSYVGFYVLNPQKIIYIYIATSVTQGIHVN